LSNVSKSESKLFHTEKDKASGRSELKLDAKGAANFKGKHTEGYNRLVAAINSDKTAVVSVQATVGAYGDDGAFHVYDVAKDFGGGTTIQTGNGNVLVASLLTETKAPLMLGQRKVPAERSYRIRWGLLQAMNSLGTV